jgi:hypothetical protein
LWHYRSMLKRILVATTLAVGVLGMAACGSGQKEVEVKGKEAEMANLAGNWEGDYKGNESGRSGTVKFSLELGRHTAEGEVLMGGATPLKIQFVEVAGGQIKGTVAPYTDPNCKCQVETSFLGTVAGDSISGMFETKVSATSKIQTGTWQVSRSK